MRTPIAFALVAAIAATSHAQTIVPKQIAAPPTDILNRVVTLPAPETTGEDSFAALVPVNFAERNGAWSDTIRVPLDDARNLRFALLAPEADDFRITLIDAGGETRLTPQAPLATRATFAPGVIDQTVTRYRLEAPQRRELTLRIDSDAQPRRAGDQPDAWLAVATDSPVRLYTWTDQHVTRIGDPVTLAATLHADEHTPRDARPDAIDADITEARVVITTPSGRTIEAPMNARADDAFDARFTLDEPGVHRARTVVRATLPNGRELLRTSQRLLRVIEHRADLLDASAWEGADGRFVVDVAAAGELPEKVIASAEVWAVNDDGAWAPVCWIGGMSSPRPVFDDLLSVSLHLHPDWFTRARTDALHVELRNVRIQTADGAGVIARLDRTPLVLPPMHRRDAKPITDDMLMGRPDADLGIPAPTPEQAASALGVDRAVGAHNLMLMHGYCADGNPWPTSNFAGFLEIFSDPNANRTHDDFALLVAALGQQSKSFGVVAHSQGGCASLHLYTYYFSGLDWARGNRLIQSLGTPYQGTALAGDLAAIGDIFGAGCSENADLTYDGAAAWLSNIPTWARQRVHYWTTSFEDAPFGFDYCSLATDFFLSDPEDGVTEQSAGQLPGANNMGHTTGWCHTTDMRDPAQYLDASRNADMNANAAR